MSVSRSCPLLVLLSLLLPRFACAAGFQTVELKSGATVVGEVLAEKPDRLVVDLGFRILEVPRDEVLRVLSPDAGEADAATARSSELFRTAGAEAVMPVGQNVKHVAEAVVQVRTPSGLGSGFIIDSDGYVVTNHHVIAREHNIEVTQYRTGERELSRVTFTKVRIVALDARLDLALLKIDDETDAPFPTVAIGDSQSLIEGQTVFAIGSPLGLERTVSQGIVSLKNRAMSGQLYIQTTTQINPGNSGGPLFNLRREVVGVNNMKAMMTGIEGLSFAIPADVLKQFLRNHDAYAFDPRNPNAGFRYLTPPTLPAKAEAESGN